MLLHVGIEMTLDVFDTEVEEVCGTLLPVTFIIIMIDVSVAVFSVSQYLSISAVPVVVYIEISYNTQI